MNDVPAMETVMQIISIDEKKKAPGILGMNIRPDLDIFHVHCLPKSVIEKQQWGWEKLNELHLSGYAENLAKEYNENLEVFKCVIPMTRHTIELNRYEPGSFFTLNVKGMMEAMIL